MSEPIDFIVAARNAGRDVMNEQARKAGAEWAERGQPLFGGEDAATRHLCRAIYFALRALPHLPLGARAPAGEALKKLALALDISARVFSVAAGETPAHLPDDPGSAANAASPGSADHPGTDDRKPKDVGTPRPPYYLDLSPSE